jgi:hypothetical protein
MLTDQQRVDLDAEVRFMRQFRFDRDELSERVANCLVNENVYREDFAEFLPHRTRWS